MSQFEYQPQPEKAALMVVQAHPDDECYWLGAIPYYAVGRELPVVMVCLTSGEEGIKERDYRREEEMRNACWEYGLRNEPVLPRFPDCCCRGTLEENWQRWGGRGKVTAYLVEQMRRYRPDVVLTMAADGEYGHPNHMACHQATVAAFQSCANEKRFPESRAEFGTWQPKKLYVHNWCRNKVEHNWDVPLPGTKTGTAFDLGERGIRCHITQGMHKKDLAQFHTTTFGLYWSEVGKDSEGSEDLFENVDLTGIVRVSESVGNG